MSGRVDIALVNPYLLEAQPERKRKMEPYPPLGLTSLAAWARLRGSRVAICDGTFAASIEELLHATRSTEPRLVGVYAMNSFRGEALEVVRRLAGEGRTVLCGGPDPSIYPSIYLEAGAELVAHSEGELILSEILQHYLEGTPDLDGILGISFWRDGKLVRTPPRPPIPRLEDLPVPAHDLLDLRRYARAWRGAHGRATISIMTSRGCPFRCNWCARPIFGQNFRQRRVNDVVEEMRLLVREYGFEHFWIFDDTFVVRKAWVEEFCAALRAAALPATFECMARVDQVTQRVLRLMKEAGCTRIYYGVESGSQKVLNAMDKGIRPDQVRNVAGWMHELGITMGAFIMYGYPGEEYEDILKTIELVRQASPDEFSVSVAHPMPGTGFYMNVQNELLDSWAAPEDYCEGEPVFRTRYPAFYYRLLKRRTEAEWREARRPSLARRLGVLPWKAATSLLSHLPPPHPPSRAVSTVEGLGSAHRD